MRNMFDVLLSKEDEIVYRWMWILGYVMYAVLMSNSATVPCFSGAGNLPAAISS